MEDENDILDAMLRKQIESLLSIVGDGVAFVVDLNEVDLARPRLADGKFLVESHKEYNSQSKVARLAKAYESTSAECTFDIPDHVKTVSTQYDGLGRMIKRTLEDGTFKSVVYQPLKVMRYDQEDNTKGSAHFDTPQTDEFDGLGRLMKRTELDKPGHPIVTQYTWTHLNVYGDSQLAKVIDAKGNEKVQSYDMLGRITKVVDPDRQTTTYKYDDAGNMIERTDDRGITIAATYDDLDRPLTIEEKGKPETQISFVYDTTTKEYASKFTKLRIVAIKSPHIQSYYTYNNRGQLVGVRRNTLGHDFDFGFGYDNIDRLTSIDLDLFTPRFVPGTKHTHEVFARRNTLQGQRRCAELSSIQIHIGPRNICGDRQLSICLAASGFSRLLK